MSNAHTHSSYIVFSAAFRAASMTAFIAGVGSPKVTRLSVCSIGASVCELDKPSLLDQRQLREADRTRLLLDDLDKLHRRLHLDDVRSFRNLAAEQLGLDHGRHTAAAADHDNANRLVLAAELRPVGESGRRIILRI